MDEEEFLEILGEAFHTAFRKATNTEQANKIHKLITELPEDEWGRVLYWVYECIEDLLNVDIKKE